MKYKKYKRFILSAIAIVLLFCVIILILNVHQQTKKDEKTTVKKASSEKTKDSYESLLKEGDALLADDKTQAAGKYSEAAGILPEKEDAYAKLLNLYISNSDIPASKSIIQQIEENVSSPSPELQAILDKEKQKNWYLVSSRISLYQVEDDKSDAFKLVAGEMNTFLADTYDCYYKYDAQGRLIESNAGSLPFIFSRNDGAYRLETSRSIIDTDIFTDREGSSADYALFHSYGHYGYPENSDGNNIFTYTYNDDGSIVETITRNGEIKYKIRYTFRDHFLSSQEILNSETNGVSKAYTGFNYNNDYVSFQTDGDTAYWEESYTSDGILDHYTLEFDADDFDFCASNADCSKYFKDKPISKAKFNFYFEDSSDENGNIIRRTEKYDIIGGIHTGRNFDGTYHDWATLQEGILSKVVDYQYVYCTPDELGKSPEDALSESTDDSSYYSSILSEYRQAEQNNFSGGRSQYPHVNKTLLQYGGDSLYYAIIDLCGDGIPELFIAQLSDPDSGEYNIMDIYGYSEGSAQHLAVGLGLGTVPLDEHETMGNRSNYTLCENNFLKCSKSSGASDNSTSYYSLNENSNVLFLENGASQNGDIYGKFSPGGLGIDEISQEEYDQYLKDLENEYPSKSGIHWIRLSDE